MTQFLLFIAFLTPILGSNQVTKERVSGSCGTAYQLLLNPAGPSKGSYLSTGRLRPGLRSLITSHSIHFIIVTMSTNKTDYVYETIELKVTGDVTLSEKDISRKKDWFSGTDRNELVDAKREQTSG